VARGGPHSSTSQTVFGLDIRLEHVERPLDDPPPLLLLETPLRSLKLAWSTARSSPSVSRTPAAIASMFGLFSRISQLLREPSRGDANLLPQTSGRLRLRQRAHPAHIPYEAPGGSRTAPRIPATTGAQIPAHGGNPRLFPASPEAPRPACHAGGRGFQSRRSRKSPANQNMCFTYRPPASFHPALIPHRK
jgi:hypothetical protein